MSAPARVVGRVSNSCRIMVVLDRYFPGCLCKMNRETYQRQDLRSCICTLYIRGGAPRASKSVGAPVGADLLLSALQMIHRM